MNHIRWIPPRRTGEPKQPYSSYNYVNGWGDKLAAWLSYVGITEQSYRRWKVRWGFADSCNCAQRIQNLNKLGRWVYRCRKRLQKLSSVVSATVQRQHWLNLWGAKIRQIPRRFLQFLKFPKNS